MDNIAGVILAGGRATRMGGRDKAFLVLGGMPLIAGAISRLAPQLGALAINSNAGPEPFSAYRSPVIRDRDDRRSGPLAGILAGMRWAATLEHPSTALVSVAVDTPFFPIDLVERLAAASNECRTIAMAASGGCAHPTFALWPLALADDLERFVEDGSTLKVTYFMDRHGRRIVEFPLVSGVDPFFNVNTPTDLQQAEAMLGRMR